MHPSQWRTGALVLSLGLAHVSWGGMIENPRDLTTEPTLYVVGYAHLDTQWRWTYPQVIREMIPNTMHDNFDLFQDYPDYIFNFSGARRYRLMQEYYPDDFALVQQYVASGQWFPCGSSVDECDVNVPGAESLIRQVLYGNAYFRQQFGQDSAEFMLPDCFGFPASLPSILGHCGLIGFSTQKLTWGSAVGIPFNVGVWKGLNDTEIVAALNPGSYVGSIDHDLSGDSGWLNRINANGAFSGVYADYSYFGTGDQGGAPGESSVQWMETSVNGDGPVHVVSSTAEQMFLDIPPALVDSLPTYQGDLLLTQHSAGSITSQAYMKRWNRKNEVLADAAERAAVFAKWLGGPAYPKQRLLEAWILTLGSQMHDILPGTCHPTGYEYAWNDELLAMNQFATVLEGGVSTLTTALDTQVSGRAVVVYNPLSIAREDVVEAEVTLPGGPPPAVRVVGPDGAEVPSQIKGVEGERVTVLFLATVPSVGLAVYDVQPAATPAVSTLQVTTSALQNDRYVVTLNANGDVAQIYDNVAGRNLLTAPTRLAITEDTPGYWPAWNIDWDDQQQAPRSYVSGPATIEIVEDGAARVAVQITRDTEGSHFVQTIRVAAGGAGERVEFANTIDWHTSAGHLKAEFPLAASNPLATYNWDVGTIQRANNNASKYEVPTHQWIDLTHHDGQFGVTVLTDFKYGSDKPTDQMLRLTLLRTPGAGNDYGDQATQDWGQHDILYGLAGHVGDWRAGQTDWQAWRLNQPLIAFTAPPHAGPLGRSVSFLQVDDPRVRVLAVKKAEASDELIVRLVELDGAPAPLVRVTLPTPIVAAREVDGQERQLGTGKVTDGALVTSLSAYGLRTFALKLGPPPVQVAALQQTQVALPYNRQVASNDGTSIDGGFDAAGRCLPAEMLPAQVEYRGVTFNLAASAGPDAVQCAGQTVALPAGNYNRLYLLAAASNYDHPAVFTVGATPVELTIQHWGGYIGQWYNRTWIGAIPELTYTWPYPLDSINPPYLRGDPVAWFASHRHSASGQNEPYRYAYLFAYGLDVPAGATTLTLPNDGNVIVMAATVALDPAAGTAPAQVLIEPYGPPVPDVRPALQPIAATGWNRDIVVERTGGTPYSNHAQSFDVPNNYALYEHGLPGGEAHAGLPTDGTFTSYLETPVTHAQLQPYYAPNVLQLSSNTNSGTLTLAPAARRPYDVLGVFAASANARQDSTGTLTLKFTDGSTSQALTYNAFDWFFHTEDNALRGLGRLRLNGGFDNGVGDNPRIYQTTLDLVALGLSGKALQSITFDRADNANTTAIFALSGAGPQAADIDRDGYVNATDFLYLSRCLAGPGITTPPAAATAEHFARADQDGDGDVDLADVALFQEAFGAE